MKLVEGSNDIKNKSQAYSFFRPENQLLVRFLEKPCIIIYRRHNN